MKRLWLSALLALASMGVSITLSAASEHSEISDQARALGYKDVCANVCHQRKYVWFRIPKAASCSIDAMLHIGGKRDIRYPQVNPDETSKRAWVGMPTFNPEEYEGYFKFTFVRNPWERIVSIYCKKVKLRRPVLRPCWGMSFEEFVDWIDQQDLSTVDVHFRPQTWQLPLKEIDFVGRLETFNEDIHYVMGVLGITCPKIIHKNRGSHQHYSHYYNDHTREVIARKYRDDIVAFGYTFETERTEDEGQDSGALGAV